MIICQTPFRISFFGGGTDWPEYFTEHGGAVLGTAIDRYIYHSVTPLYSKLFDHSIRLAYRKVECVKNVRDIEHRPFREILTYFGIERDIEISLSADLPSFSGLGSSSSFTVGLINALSAFKGRFITRSDLAYTAIRLEHEVMKESIGCQDQVFAAFGGFNVVEFRRSDDIVVSRIAIGRDRIEELDQSLLMFFTGFTRSADAVEAGKKARMLENKKNLSRLRGLVDQGHALLTGTAPLSEFGELLDLAWSEKKALSAAVSSSQIDAMYRHARECGALGGKVLGAGGGGFMLLFVPPDRQAKFREAFADYLEVTFRIDAPGSYIVHS